MCRVSELTEEKLSEQLGHTEDPLFDELEDSTRVGEILLAEKCLQNRFW